MTNRFTRTVAAALTVALVAGSTLAPTAASAADGRRTAFAIGAVLGLGGALLGAATANSQPRYAEPRGYGLRSVGFAEDCFEKPVTRFDAYRGERVIVGYRTVCR